ncbi:MAG: CHAP domain-containing protein [Ferruginibacter sp.]|nr:CHAP domain-containing protein [Rhodoferax sp.]
MITVQTVLARATAMAGRGTVYWAGTGGFDPHAASPDQPLAIGQKWPTLAPEEQAMLRPLAEAAGLDVDDPELVAPACDCSGFVCWALGISRNPAPQRWINTDSVWDDATGSGVQFRKIERAVPGCLVVYPQAGSGERFGHIALVTEATADGRAVRIVHCSAANFGSAPSDAIKVTAPEAFERQPKSIYAWFEEMQR